MSEERLQKLLARAGLASRRGAERFLRDGRVTVNGVVARLGDRADPVRDAIKVDGRRLRLPSTHRYLLLNKPRGCLVTRSDPEGRRTVFDLLPPGLGKGLFPVGRLDYHSEGLLLLTDDGDLAQRISHPSHGCSKTYRVRVKGRPDAGAVQRLRAGIVLDGRRTGRARIRPLRGASGDTNSEFQVEIGEGRSRQIREMFFRIGHPVKRLKRVAIGSLRDPDLPAGAARDLTAREVKRLVSAGRRRRSAGSRGKSR